MEVAITDCARNFCESQTQTDLPTADLCQLACKLDESSCQSWAFINNGENILCDRYDCPMSDWIPTCKEVGGPVNVNLDYCLHQDTGCDAFKKGHCNFDEQHVLANVPGSFPPASCQEFCQNYPGCNFFYTDVHFC